METSTAPSLWQRFKSIFYSTPDAKSAAYGLVDQIFPIGQPPKRGTKELFKAVRTMPWLHAAIWKIAFAIARTEFGIYKADRSTMVRHARFSVKRGWSEKKTVRGAMRLEKHPLLDVLDNPNPLLGAVGTLAFIQAYLDTKGEVPIVIERGRDGKPLELWPVPPHWLRAMPTPNDPVWHFSYMGWQRDVPEKDVLYLRMPDLENPYGRGAGTAEALSDELDIDEFAAQHIKSFFFNRALPDAFVSFKGVVNGRKAEEEIERFEKKLEDKHRGVGKGWRPHFMSGDVTVTPVGTSMKDQQMRELRNLQRDTLLQVFGIPPEVMGIVENSNRATIASALFIFALNVLCPRLDFLADALTQLAREWDETLFVSFASPVEDDKEFTLRVMTAQPTLFRKNEWRELAGKEPAEEFAEDFVDKPAAPVAAPGADPTAGPASNDQKPGEKPTAEEPADNAEAEKAHRPRRRAA
jgi:HK97 family phage portal protein